MVLGMMTRKWIGSLLLAGVASLSLRAEDWKIVQTEGEPVPRHEAAFIEYGGKFYLLGGRRINPTSIYDPAQNRWTSGSKPPIEAHHSQPALYGKRILIVCAMTGPFPNEVGLERVLAYLPEEDRWEWSHSIPQGRRRGGAGVVVVDGLVYVVGGIVRGHMGGYVNWVDRYDPRTGEWKELPDAPHARDHFQAAHLDGKIYAAGGRRTSRETGEVFSLTVPEVDVYDLAARSWATLPHALPTSRAGSMTLALGEDVLVVGGESAAQKVAHAEVEAWDTQRHRWEAYPSLERGRHGTGVIHFEGCLYTCSGSGNRGGSPELTSLERLEVGKRGN